MSSFCTLVVSPVVRRLHRNFIFVSRHCQFEPQPFVIHPVHIMESLEVCHDVNQILLKTTEIIDRIHHTPHTLSSNIYAGFSCTFRFIRPISSRLRLFFQGSPLELAKSTNIYNQDSTSSLRANSSPRCTDNGAYLGVPLKHV